jgi:uncharacterized protein YfdQ (DUF2303 family)
MTNLDNSAIESIAGLTRAGTDPIPLEPGTIYSVHHNDGSARLIDLTDDKYLDTPRRKRGAYSVTDVAGFSHYYTKHSDPGTELYADRRRLTVTAVLDAHLTNGPRWEQHTLEMKLQYSEAMAAWMQVNNRLMSQEEFAEHIEEWRHTIQEPAAAEVYELVQSFHATTKVDFKSGLVLATGQRQLVYTENTTAAGGAKGNLTIPETLRLAVPVFRRAEVADSVIARLRYQIREGQLSMGVKLTAVEEVIDGAFDAVVRQVNEATGMTVVYSG